MSYVSSILYLFLLINPELISISDEKIIFDNTHGAGAALQERACYQFPCVEEYICLEVRGGGAKAFYQGSKNLPGVAGITDIKRVKAPLSPVTSIQGVQ